jgi:hypothetical protein
LLIANTPTHTPSPTLSPNLVLYDDFNGGHIDEGNWMLPTNENLIYQADGVLNFVSPQSAQDTVRASLSPVPTGRPIREVSVMRPETWTPGKVKL